MKFKVGDKVKLSGFVDFGADSGFEPVDCTGLVGEVVIVDPGCNVGLEYQVKAAYSDGAPSYWLPADQLELVTEAPTVTLGPGVQIGDVVQLNHGGPKGTVVDIDSNYADMQTRACVSFGYTQEYWPLVRIRKVPDVLP